MNGTSISQMRGWTISQLLWVATLVSATMAACTTTEPTTDPQTSANTETSANTQISAEIQTSDLEPADLKQALIEASGQGCTWLLEQGSVGDDRKVIEGGLLSIGLKDSAGNLMYPPGTPLDGSFTVRLACSAEGDRDNFVFLDAGFFASETQATEVAAWVAAATPCYPVGTIGRWVLFNGSQQQPSPELEQAIDSLSGRILADCRSADPAPGTIKAVEVALIERTGCTPEGGEVGYLTVLGLLDLAGSQSGSGPDHLPHLPLYGSFICGANDIYASLFASDTQAKEVAAWISAAAPCHPVGTSGSWVLLHFNDEQQPSAELEEAIDSIGGRTVVGCR
jgi:hypothetical protein